MYIEAAFMGLDHQPVTPEATALCADVAHRIEEWERRQQMRSNARRERLAAFLSAVGLLIGDLLAVSEKRPRRWLYRPMGKKEFTGKEVSYRTFRSIFEALRSLALIDVKPGFVRKMEGGRQHRRCTRLRSSLRLRGARGAARGPCERRQAALSPASAGQASCPSWIIQTLRSHQG
jgi:hypothetical protein